jgi:hypothetical protein
MTPNIGVLLPLLLLQVLQAKAHNVNRYLSFCASAVRDTLPRAANQRAKNQSVTSRVHEKHMKKEAASTDAYTHGRIHVHTDKHPHMHRACTFRELLPTVRQRANVSDGRKPSLVPYSSSPFRDTSQLPLRMPLTRD